MNNKIGHIQSAMIDLLWQRNYISVHQELNPFKRTVTLMDEDGNEIQPVRNSLVESLIKRDICKIEMVHSTVMPDTETYRVTLKDKSTPTDNEIHS